MAISVDQFVRQLVDSGLMSAAAVNARIDAIPDKKPRDGEQLARLLVRQKNLTGYQAQQIYAGKGKSLILGNYVILDKLGQGGMGLVLKAEHQRMKRIVALKVLSPRVTRTPNAVRRFQREVEAAAKLTHTNIVIAHDADEASGTHFLVMEYVEGNDLSSVVKEHGPLPLEQALDCILQAARGLAYAHERGVVHRDIKPANLLLDKQGVIKILDMGLARLETAGEQQDQLTGTGQIMGTVDYMAPEQAMDTKHADTRADIYSLGVTLWYLLTGRALFEGETTVEKLMAHQTKPAPSLRSACADISPELDAVFTRMVAKTAEARYQTMAEVIADLERCRSGASAAAPAVSTAQEEDARLEDFLREIVTPSHHRPVPARQASRAAAAVAATIASIADPEATLDSAAPQVATDPQTEQSLPGGRLVTPSAKPVRRPPRPPWWQDWRIQIAAGAGGLLLVLLGIWVIVRDKEGREVARIKVPEGGSVTVETEKDSPDAKPLVPWKRPTGMPSSQDRSTPKPSAPATPPAVTKPVPPWTLPAGSPPPAIAPFDAAKAKEHQAAWAKYLGVQVEMANSLGLKFMLIPPGEFDMGSTAEEVAKYLEEARAKKLPDPYIQRLPAEAPKHRVRITKPFYLGRCEVAQGEYERVVGSNLSQRQGDPTCPVEKVNWDESSAFCRKLGEVAEEQAARAEYRLPTEAEWEYACRAGTTTTWYSGNDEGSLKEHAWFNDSAGGKSHPVGQKSPNAWGLYDMHGNVFEWCQDWWGDRYYATSPMDDAPGASGGSGRVFRGGSWYDGASCGRASCRNKHGAGIRGVGLGFRLARTVSLPSASR